MTVTSERDPVSRATATYLVQLLLPLFDNDGRAIDGAHFRAVRDELTARFGGLTAYTRAPADGVWMAEEAATRDQIVVYEVMTETLDRTWWRAYRHTLEQRFRQQTLVMRVLPITIL